jgi:hypothetical protein
MACWFVQRQIRETPIKPGNAVYRKAQALGLETRKGISRRAARQR